MAATRQAKWYVTYFLDFANTDANQGSYYPIPIQFAPQNFQCPKEDRKHLGKLNSSKRRAGNECITKAVFGREISFVSSSSEQELDEKSL